MLIAFIFVGSFCIVIKPNNMITNKFFGNKVDYDMILELWSISSFESGTASKSSHLERVALEFEKQNKGAYILISNMTVDECVLKIESGGMPDIFSFTGNVGKVIEKYLESIEPENNIKDCLRESAKNDLGETLAYPWAVGGYVAISSGKRIENSNNDCEIDLFSNLMNLFYEKKLKKSSKTVYSLCFGAKNGNNPNQALLQEYNLRNIKMSIEKNSIMPDFENRTSYESYASFLNGDSVVLLGTQRDLARIEMREKSGREDGFIVDYFSAYSDLVDYVGVVDKKDNVKLEIAKQFAKFLTQETAEKKLSKIGLFPTINLNENLYQEQSRFFELENKLKYLEVVPNIFI